MNPELKEAFATWCRETGHRRVRNTDGEGPGAAALLKRKGLWILETRVASTYRPNFGEPINYVGALYPAGIRGRTAESMISFLKVR